MGVICIGVDASAHTREVDIVNVITATEAIAKLSQIVCDAVVIGPRVPDLPVGEIVDMVVRRYPLVPVILVADHPREGVWEHMPFADGRLGAAITRAVEVARLRRAAVQGPDGDAPVPAGPEMEQTFRRGSIREMERLMIFDRLNQLGQNRTRSAESLDISVRTLRNKLREYREQAVVGAAVREEG
jgi:DNA-binding NtrC family response regulator